MFSETQMSLAKTVLEPTLNFVLHLDATGSVVQKWGSAPVYLYAVVLPTPIRGEPPLPLLEWISNSHNTIAISSVLFTWWLQAKNFLPPPNLIVTDCSWAFLHATSHVFSNMSLEQQLDRQWAVLSSNEISEGSVTLRLCASHFIKAIGNRLVKKAIRKQVALMLMV